jgi:hypothetical protein
MSVTGWKLDQHDREILLERIGSRWPNVIADLITLDAGVKRLSALPSNASAHVVGEADDGVGLE